jgi:hypothetical protein
VLGRFSVRGVQKLHKNSLQKVNVENLFPKKSTKIQIRFFLDLFYYVFGRFTVRGVQKHGKTLSKISTKISMAVFPRLFLFYRVFGCFSAMGVQKHNKKPSTKINRVEKFLQKIRPKIPNRLFLEFYLPKKKKKKKSNKKNQNPKKTDRLPFFSQRTFFLLPSNKLSS